MKTTKSGYLHKRGKVYYLEYSHKGNRKSLSLKTSNENIAKKKRDEILLPALMADTKEKVLFHVAESRKLVTSVKYSLDIVWEQYLSSTNRPNTGAGTLGNYKRNWELFKKWINKTYTAIVKLNQITTAEADSYSKHLSKKGISASTFNYHIFSLRHIFKTLCPHSENPFSVNTIQRKREIQANRKPFTNEQILKLLSSFDDPKLRLLHKPEMKVLFYLGARTGARLIDCAKMKNTSLNMTDKKITYVPIKTRRIQRTVSLPMAKDLLEILKEYRMSTTRKGEYLLPPVAKRYVTNKDGVVQDAIKVLEFCKIRKRKLKKKKKKKSTLNHPVENQRINTTVLYGFHSFRHAFASHMANNDVPIAVLAEMLGDDIRTLQKYYVKIADETKQRAIDTLDAN